MLSFQKLRLRDIPVIQPFFAFSLSRACDNTVGGTFMWRDYFDTEYAVFHDTLIFKVKYIGGQTAFSLPLGPDVSGSLPEIEQYCHSIGVPIIFCTATEEDIEVYSRVFPAIRLNYNADWSDYLYSAEDLISLTGRKYSGQRNHINHFKREFPNYRFEPIVPDNLLEVIRFFRARTEAVDKGTAIFHEEQDKTLELLTHYGQYRMLGGLLRVGEKVAAFAVGEKVRDTLFVHVEKADNAYKGAYQMIANEFPKYFASKDILYINREEDVGDPGLREAKEAYHPVAIIKKYTVAVEP
ncbi:MAG: phosphatidylglycerol lysyltransferase domain-containing protein [Firmicutes bacterium]|nr:phosphatidylglycerol lysyltransferase domain-containing protein [Bacillota bacterium]